MSFKKRRGHTGSEWGGRPHEDGSRYWSDGAVGCKDVQGFPEATKSQEEQERVSLYAGETPIPISNNNEEDRKKWGEKKKRYLKKTMEIKDQSIDPGVTGM